MRFKRGGRRTQIRFLRLRLLVLWLKDLSRMRLHRYADDRIMSKEAYKYYHEVGCFQTKIKWRPELGEFNENRIHNMAECARRISGIFLKPGQYFSLMRTIGHPTAERGFKDGPMLVNGKLEYVSGGGICQVSTTLFNAALVSGMTIVEKWNHTWDVWGENRFIDLGRDATYAYGRRNLIIRNPFSQALVLEMEVDRENLNLTTRVLAEESMIIDSEVKIVVEEISNETGMALKAKGYHVHCECSCIRDNQRIISYSKHETYKPLYK